MSIFIGVGENEVHVVNLNKGVSKGCIKEVGTDSKDSKDEAAKVDTEKRWVKVDHWITDKRQP